MKRDDAFRVLARQVAGEIVVATYTSAFDWLVVRPDDPLNYVAVGVMGLASSHGLGLAVGRPDRRVIVLDGDGSLLMNLGTLATIASVAPENLFHFVCENGTYEANGGHPIPAQSKVDFAGLAAAAGYPASHRINELPDLEARLPGILKQRGPVFIDLKVTPGAASPKNYPYLHGADARAKFKAAIKP
jgi:sulfopyruvate decarboxylase subunit beta